MYRNVVYNSRERLIELFTWDEEGNRIQTSFEFEPYIYLETNKTPDCYSIYNTPVRKKTFQTAYDRNQFIERGECFRIFENFNVIQQALIDRFWKENESPEFTQFPLKIGFIDIETYSTGAFPKPEEANDTINVITCYDTLGRHFHTWGLKKLSKQIEGIHYHYCKDEETLLTYFVEYLEKERFDILSGWNYILFDMPYIINRINRILGEEYSQRISPTGKLYQRNMRDDFGRMKPRWFLEGISNIDYLDVYKKFNYQPRESYRLDAIGEAELGERKLDYGSSNLSELADTDWDKFVEYNVQDVNLLVNLDKKLKYFTLLRMIAYAGLTTFESAMGTIGPVSGAAAITARKRGQVVPTFIKDEGDQKIPGAYVSEPVRGFQNNVVSFDATSLYPSIMMSLNLSPETKAGWLTENEDGTFNVKTMNKKVYTLTKEKLDIFFNKEKISVSAANVMFTHKKKGVIPEMIEYYFNTRVETNKQLTKVEKKLSKLDKNDPEYKKFKYEQEYLESKQLAQKYFINGAYGYFANRFSHLGDKDIAKSITLTGQSIIKKANDILWDFVREQSENPNANTPCIYNDTDSSYITITDILKHKNIKLADEKKHITVQTLNIIHEMQDYLNNKMIEWVRHTYRTDDCKVFFKREVIADVGIFVEKKRYILRVLNEKDINKVKIKYKGVEVVRSTMPKAVKVLVKKITETMLDTQDLFKTTQAFNDAYQQFMKMDMNEITITSGMSTLEEYSSKCNGWQMASKMPFHMKGAYYYNKIIDELNLGSKYEKLVNGDKVRAFHVKSPNKYNIKVFAYKHYFPDEVKEIIQPDFEVMFLKIMYAAINRLYNCVGWKLRKPTEQVKTDLLSFFKL